MDSNMDTERSFTILEGFFTSMDSNMDTKRSYTIFEGSFTVIDTFIECSFTDTDSIMDT
jgi:hypothetical protein